MPVDRIRQKTINNFFAALHNLPKDWKNRQNKGESISDMVDSVPDIAIAEKTFKDTYKLGINAFIKYGRGVYEEEGFPMSLKTDDIKYRGERKV